MTLFILSTILLTLIALLFILPAMMRPNKPVTDDYDDINVSIARERLKELKQQRDNGEITEAVFQQLHDELEASLALDLNDRQEVAATVAAPSRFAAISMVLVIPVLAVLFYAKLGTLDAVDGKAAQQAVEIPAGENRPQMSIEEAIAKLQLRLQQEPDNAEGWFMLAKTYMTVQQYPQAVEAYKTTISLVGEEPDLLLRYADAVAMSEGGRLTGTAAGIIEKVLQLAPDSPTALWMAGTAQSQQGNFEQALMHWYKLRPMLNGEPEAEAQLSQLIGNAESQLDADTLAGLKQSYASATPLETEPAVSIDVEVQLDPGLQQQVAPGDTLFIFARAIDGPPMPLAAVRETVAALPLRVQLSDAMAMMPQLKLSNFEQVALRAVVSKSGRPGIQPGDLFAELSPVSVKGSDTVHLLINQVQP